MPTRKRTVEVEVVVDDKNAAKSLGRIEKSVSKTGKVMSDFGKIAAVAFGASKILDFAGDTVRAASDLEESTNAVTVSFGRAADGVLAIGDNSAEAFGLAQSEFNSLAVGFQAFVSQVSDAGGGPVDQVLGDLTTRIADFASVMNLDVPEAADKFRSGLAGETEPLRKFGIDVSAAAVSTKALELGLGGANGKLSEGDKVLARYQLIMEQTEKTAGDFANTADSAANSQRRLNASFEDFKARAGDDLLPVVEDLAAKGITLFDVLDEDVNLGWTQRLSAAMQVLLGESNESTAAYVEQKVALNDLEDAADSTADVMSDDADQALRDFARGMEDAEQATLDAAGAVRDLTSANLEAASPTFALFQAQERAAAAADKYAEAVTESGQASDEAAEAAVDLAKADAELEAAAQVFADQGGAASIAALEDMLIQAGVLPETIQAIKDQIAELNRTPVRRDLIGPSLGDPAFTSSSGKIFRHEGGVVPGTPGENVPIIAQAGEHVTRRANTGHGGASTLVNLNVTNPSADLIAELVEMQRRGLR